ncbi:TonB-dependent receptor plug domain-containing protein [Algibacter mikhailovii]|uniref:TonB-dependent receptor plug domain-containing protein n=1 Tax=Algibacter mikhailovii TaxID=425498 RepID=UPI002494B25E|nr:TonB-dependent receptor plug domain-containing protein [Algibacter mikhailovii]
MFRYKLVALLIFLTVINVQGQNTETAKLERITLTGVVTNYNNKPIKGVRIFIDSLKTNVKTNKKGSYEVVVTNKNKLITAYSSKYGLIDIDYHGENVVNFIFPEGAELIANKKYSEMGYGIRSYDDAIDYSSYSNIYDLLKAKFPNLDVNGEKVTVRGAGTSLSGGAIPPIYLVNGTQVFTISRLSPADIKSISVERVTSSIYGSRGAGGIIKIKLK